MNDRLNLLNHVNKPLTGYTVLDLTWIYSGPYCTSLLYDLGAEVIKIEAPGYGDQARGFPPFRNGASGYFYALNRGKKSVALDLKTDEGKTLFLRLAEKADVVVENYLPGVMERLGIGFDALRKANPGLIYGSIHGFGSFGPYSHLPGLDPIAQAMGGLMTQSGFRSGPPLKTGPAVTDALSGVYLALGLVAAIHERDRTGVGRKVEVGMMDAVFSVLEESVVRASMTGEALPRRGNTDPIGAPWDAFETGEGKWVMVCCIGAAKFEAVFRGIGRTDLAERFGGEGNDAEENRIEHLSLLNAAFAEWAINRTEDQLLEICRSLRIPCGTAKDVAELLEDPHLIARRMVVEVDHPKLGKIKTYNNPVMLDNRSVGIENGENPLEPEIGEHSREALQGILNLTEDEIEKLYASGALWR